MDSKNKYGDVGKNRSSRPWLRLIGALSFLLASSCAPTLSGRLTEGTTNTSIYHQDGRINISLINTEDQRESHIVKLNPNGTFDSPAKLKAGLYLVEALVPGYSLRSMQIELKGAQTVELELERIENSSADLIRYSGGNQGVGSGKVNLTPPQL